MKKLRRFIVRWLLPGFLGVGLLLIVVGWILSIYGWKDEISIGLPLPAPANVVRTAALHLKSDKSQLFLRFERSEMSEAALQRYRSANGDGGFHVFGGIERGIHVLHKDTTFGGSFSVFLDDIQERVDLGLLRNPHTGPYEFHDPAQSITGYMILIPDWSAAGVVLVGLIVTLYVRRRGRIKPGHCVQCGYDLRVTPDRCPECGAVPSAV